VPYRPKPVEAGENVKPARKLEIWLLCDARSHLEASPPSAVAVMRPTGGTGIRDCFSKYLAAASEFTRYSLVLTATTGGPRPGLTSATVPAPRGEATHRSGPKNNHLFRR
jgi:hypothetical protein